MKWFTDTFLKGFNHGETRITEKQYRIFERYLKDDFYDGYINGYRGKVAGLKIKAYEWHSVAGVQYFVDIEPA